MNTTDALVDGQGHSEHLLARFLLAGLVADAVNFSARFLLSEYFDYSFAIMLAYCLGMATAFMLNRKFVFRASQNGLRKQVVWFLGVNLMAFLQTLLLSLLLARVVLPRLHITWHNEEIAHAIGIAVPIFTSYLGHRHVTFR